MIRATTPMNLLSKIIILTFSLFLAACATLTSDIEVETHTNPDVDYSKYTRNINQVDKDPDLLVAFAAGIDTTALELKEKPGSETKVLQNTPKAALVIALIDADTGYLVWMGYAVGDAQEQQTIENIRIRIDYAVREILKPL